MRSRILLNAFLLLVAVALGLVVIWEPGKKKPGEPVKLTTLDPKSIRHLRIESADSEPIKLEKKNETWQLISPFPLPANGFKAMTLTEAAAATSQARFAADGRDLATFGLAPPRARLQLGDIELLFGDTDPLQGQRYVMVEGLVHLIADRFYHHLTAGAPGFVHPAPLGPDPRPRVIKLPDAEARWVEDQWNVLPEGLQVSADAVTRFVDAWRNAQSTRVKRMEQTLIPEGTVSIELEAGETVQFKFAYSESELILMRIDPGLQYHLPRASGERLLSLTSAEADP